MKSFLNYEELVESQETSFPVIPVPHQVQDKLQPVKDSYLSENPVFKELITELEPGFRRGDDFL